MPDDFRVIGGELGKRQEAVGFGLRGAGTNSQLFSALPSLSLRPARRRSSRVHCFQQCRRERIDRDAISIAKIRR